jgi:hypothetical protein
MGAQRPDFGYKNYSRDHVWRCAQFRLARVFRQSAARRSRSGVRRGAVELPYADVSRAGVEQGFCRRHLEDNAVGQLEKNANGELAITRILPTAAPSSRRRQTSLG